MLRLRDCITPARGLIQTQQTHKNVSKPTNRRETSKALHYFAHSPGLLRKQQSTWTEKTAQSTKKTPKKNTWVSVPIETTWWKKGWKNSIRNKNRFWTPFCVRNMRPSTSKAPLSQSLWLTLLCLLVLISFGWFDVEASTKRTRVHFVLFTVCYRHKIMSKEQTEAKKLRLFLFKGDELFK